MSTREDKKKSHPGAVNLGLEGNSYPTDIELPPCTIEDVDRSLFTLLNEQLPFQYEQKGTQKRVPVIFATGERYAVLRRKEPLRDKNNALILPLISVMRTGIAQDASPASGYGQNLPITIRRKIDKSTGIYKRLVNTEGFENAPDLSHPRNAGTAGWIASRLNQPASPTMSDVKGFPGATLSQNVYETITMPPVKFFTANYDITFWCQYTMQMNDMISAVMSMYQDNHKRTFRLETDKGYWFVAYVGGEMSPQENFDDFSDDERLVKYSFTVAVNGYQLAPDYPGAPIYLRRTVSSTEVSFDMRGSVPETVPSTVLSGDPSAFALEDLATINDPLPGQSIGGTGSQASLAIATGNPVPGASHANTDSREGNDQLSQAAPREGSEAAGGDEEAEADIIVMHEVHPITGEKIPVYTKKVSRNSRQGETVHRVVPSSVFGNINPKT